LTEIKRNSDYIINITGMTHEGLGVGRIDNFTVFVEGANEGESVDIKLIKVNKSYGVGKLNKVLYPSQSRSIPFCNAYKRCGGCSLQHMDYKAQLVFKTGLVRDSIKRIGKLENVEVYDTIGMESPFNYRNKAQYPAAVVKGEAAIGFYEKRSHKVVEHDTCGIQDELSNRIRKAFTGYVKKSGASLYDELNGKGLIRHIMTRVGFQTAEVMVVIVINGYELPAKQELVDMLILNIPEIKSIFINVNTKNTNVILGDKSINIYGKDAIIDYIGSFKFEISPMSFFQVNPVQTEVLYGKALEYAGLTGTETVFDLYCGIGTISLFLSRKAKKVYGVEVVADAVRDAQKNAVLNNVSNIEFIRGEAEKVIPEIYSRGVKADVVVVDPPRKGCDEALLKTLVDMRPERIVYVSCNPSTLARDLKYLDENGFRTVEVQPVDMFPWTAHVECCALITRV